MLYEVITVVDPSAEYFRGMNTQQGELLIAAVITDMNVDICMRSNGSPVPGMRRQEITRKPRTAVNMTGVCKADKVLRFWISKSKSSYT